jgi:hypothetical protein
MSKKLEKNGLWESSRMMLPEHRQALVERRAPKAEPPDKPKLPTEEELKLIRSFALLPIVLTIVESNYLSMDNTSSPLKKLYITATQILMNRIHGDLVEVRKALKERGIKVYEDEKNDGTIRFRFICRGYEDSFAMIRDVVRAEISVRISRYIAAVFQEHTNKIK